MDSMAGNKWYIFFNALFLLLALLICDLAFGQECRKRELSTAPHYLPSGVFCQIDDGMTCFNLEEYKLLLKMDLDLYAERQKAVERDDIITNQALMLNQQKLVIETLEKDKVILEGQSERLGEKWRDCLAEQEGLPWSSIGIGAGVGVIVGALVGVIAYLTVDSLSK